MSFHCVGDSSELSNMFSTQANQQISAHISSRPATTHVKNPRKVRCRTAFGSIKPPSVRSLSSSVTETAIPTATSCHGRLSMTPSPTEARSAWPFTPTQVPINHLRQALRQQSESSLESETSSPRGSSSFSFPNPNCLPHGYQSSWNWSDVGTPDLMFSENSTLSLEPDLSPPPARGLFYQHDITDDPAHTELEPWLDTNFDGTAAKLCEEPNENETCDERLPTGPCREGSTSGPTSLAGYQIGYQHVRHCGMPVLCQIAPCCPNVTEQLYTSQLAPSYTFNTAVSGQKHISLCDCHGLRQHLTLLQSGVGDLSNVVARCTSQIRPRGQALPRRVQETFNSIRQTVRNDISKVESCIQVKINRIFETPLTIHDGLRTLTTLHVGNSQPTLHGLASMALLTKCTLLLQDQSSQLSVEEDIFRDEISWADFIQSDLDKQAFVLFLQLLWLSHSAGCFGPGDPRLFCPTASLSRLSTARRLMTGSHVRPRWASAYICDGLVDAIYRIACDGITSPSPTSTACQSLNELRFATFTITNVTNFLAEYALDVSVQTTFLECSAAVQKGHLSSFEEVNTHLAEQLRRLKNVGAEYFIEMLPEFIMEQAAHLSVLKITWLMGVLRASAKGGLVTECSQCGQRFSGEYRVKNMKQHKERSCRVTKKQPEYRPFSCDHCEQTFTRKDNLNSHIVRHHRISF